MFAIERYEKPGSVQDAVNVLAANASALAMAGGTDVLVKVRHTLVPAFIVDIMGLPELQVESRSPEGIVRLGAGLTFARLARSPLVLAHVPLLAEAADTVAGPQIRAMGTLGGNICNGAVSADTVAPLLALDARLRLMGPEGERVVPLAGFHLGPGKVDVRPGELLVEVNIAPEHWQGVGAAWYKYAMRQAMDIATIGCAACARVEGDRLEWLKLAFSVAAPVPVRCPAAEAVAAGRSVAGNGLEEIVDAVAHAVAQDVAPRTSWRAEKEFRLHIIQTLARRISRQAIERAGKRGGSSL